MENKKGFIVLVDISGYTKFVRTHNTRKIPFLGKSMKKTSEQHAEHIVSDLLECVINELEGTLTVNKLQGDAVLFYSVPENLVEYPKLLIEKIQSCFEIFSNRLNELAFCGTCSCDPCKQFGNLKLKSFIHYGDFLLKKVSRFEEIAGEDVILAHRLMKNSIKTNEYILFTKNVNDITSLKEFDNLEERIEKCEGLDDAKVYVFYPNRENYSEIERENISWLKQFITMNKYFKKPKTKQGIEEKFILAN